MEFNIALAHEAIASVIGAKDCVVDGDRRFTWEQTTDRTRRLAAFFRTQGLGAVTPRSQLRSDQSGQDHVALYMYNSVEYLEAMLGAFKARLVPANVNYRYRERELVSLLNDCRPSAVVFTSSLLDNFRAVLPHLEPGVLLIQVRDEAGVELLDGAVDYDEVLAATAPDIDLSECSPDDIYVVYTGGTTGYPKGVLWRQADIFVAGMAGVARSGEEYTSLDELCRTALDGQTRVLPTPPFMHNAGLWGAFGGWLRGGTVIIQRNVRRLDPVDVWQTVERERVTRLLIVGDAFARTLLDVFDADRYDVASLRTVVSGGAVLNIGLKARLAQLLDVRVVDMVGSSETGGQATQTSGVEVLSRSTFSPTPSMVVLSADRKRILSPGADEPGWLASTGRIPIAYLNHEQVTRRNFITVEGIRCALSGDRVRYGSDGDITLLGRDSATISSGGEKIFAEEVESVLRQEPAVRDAVVVGRPSDRWGEEVVALVKVAEGYEESDETRQAIVAACKREIAGYKAPKAVLFVPEVVRSPSGKPDYRWARAVAVAS